MNGTNIIQMGAEIIHGRVLNGELYAQRPHKLIYLHLCKDMFHEDFSSIVETTSSVY